MPKAPVVLLVLLLASPTTPGPSEEDGHWSSFRGPSARGVAEGFETAVEWDVPDGQHIAWRTRIPGLAHSSPVVWGDRVFVTTAVRLEGSAELSSLYGSPGYGAGGSGFSGSPVAADGKLYFTSESGEVHVVRAGPEFEVLAVNDLGEECLSTPAISRGQLIFRTRGHLLAVEPPGQE